MGDQELDQISEECVHFMRVVNAFKCYKSYSFKKLSEIECHYKKLPGHHRKLIPNFPDHLSSVENCVVQNQCIINLIIQDTKNIFENRKHHLDNDKERPISVNEFDLDKVKSTIKQFMRDWSSDGLTERNACYQPVIDEIVNIYSGYSDLSQVEILVPGAGLGRLAFELAWKGFTCQGNEFSLFMLLASNFVLNKCKQINEHVLHPWIHQTCNNMLSSDQMHSIKFPDVNPGCLPENSNFSMIAGDFLEVYKEEASWDCVASVFFLDTAANVIAYIESIYHILKPGGHWVNFGPLLYHFADIAGESSIELSYEEVRNIILQFKFEILKEKVNCPATYNQNPKSMLKYEYSCVFFVVRKPFFCDC